MPSSFDAIIIGGGSNGLVAAARLAANGWRTVLLEARSATGGQLTPEVDADGVRSLSMRPLRLAAPIDRWLREARAVPPELAAWPHPDPVVALGADGRPCLLTEEQDRAGDAVPGYLPFADTASRLAAIIAPLVRRPPPDVDRPHFADLGSLLSAATRLRRLSRAEAPSLFRWPPMPVADLVREWFADETVRAAVAGIPLVGRNTSPRAPWSSLALLWDRALLAGGRAVLFRGGPAALGTAMADAARRAGAELRTGCPVRQVTVREGRATGVVLADGRELSARAVVSCVDPRATLLDLVEPTELDPEIRDEIAHLRGSGSVAVLSMDVDAVPTLPGASMSETAKLLAATGGHVFIGPTLDDLEKAYDAVKYGAPSPVPILDLMAPDVLDPLPNGSPQMVTMTVQHVPLATGEHVDQAGLEGEALATLERAWPGFGSRVRAIRSASPATIERVWRITGGHAHHLEMAPDQLFTMRPHPTCARYETPVQGLFLCGAGTHPGGGAPGLPGWIASRIVSRALKERDA